MEEELKAVFKSIETQNEEEEKLYHKHRRAHVNCSCFSHVVGYGLFGSLCLGVFIPWSIPAYVAQIGYISGLFYYIYRKHSINSIMSRYTDVLNFQTRLVMLKRDVEGSFTIFGSRVVSLEHFNE